MQVGVQIFTGFLLTLPFQPRFRNLDTFDVVVYLAIVAMSVLSMGLFVAPVSMHRIVFRRHRRPELVAFGDRTARLGIGLLAVLFSGAVLLVTDIVVGRVFAVIAALVILGALTTLWFLIPHMVARRSGPAD